MGLGDLAFCALVAGGSMGCGADGAAARSREPAAVRPPVAMAAPALDATAAPTTAGTVAPPVQASPAGLCGFPGYLSFHPACEGAAPMKHAVLLGDVDAALAAEALVASWVGKLPPGYPLVLTRKELPLDEEARGSIEASREDRSLRSGLLGDLAVPAGVARRRGRDASPGFRVVAAFFATAAAARAFQHDVLHDEGTVHAIAGPPEDPRGDESDFARVVAVLTARSGAAYADADIAATEAELTTKPSGGDEDARWQGALAKLRPACAVGAGRVFEADRGTLYRYGRRFAPVDCGGRRAWIPWAATRLESVVRVEKGAPTLYQIIDVSCDMAAIDRTPYEWGAPLRVGQRIRARCGRGRS